MANEALHVQLDNLQREIQALQVENQKLKALGEWDNSSTVLEVSSFHKEIEELRQQCNS